MPRTLQLVSTSNAQWKKIRLEWGEMAVSEEQSWGGQGERCTQAGVLQMELRTGQICQLNMRKIIRDPLSLSELLVT